MGTPAAFDAVKPRLFGLAYRMLGSRAEAEDVVQEAYIRWHQADESTIRNPEAWLVTAATLLGKSEAAARQIVHRARGRVRGEQQRFHATDHARARLLKTFVAAVEARDEQTLLHLLAPDATWTADGGGKAAAVGHPIEGAAAIVKLLLGLQKRFAREGVTMHLGAINGETGLLISLGDRVAAAVSFVTDGERIVSAYAVVNPDKLPSPVHQEEP